LYTILPLSDSKKQVLVVNCTFSVEKYRESRPEGLNMQASSAPTAEKIADHLTEAVHEHKVLPGMKLSEDEVGEIYSVGRTVVRQALRRLAHDGLVTIERNRGAFVAKPTIKEAREVFEARALLEPRITHAAAERSTDADIALLHGSPIKKR
jgi:DNA-binding GntR family transcriptional regulator